MIRSVVFDVGETLIDDSRGWARWADWIGVPAHTVSAVMGAVTAAGRDNAETFRYFRTDFDVTEERRLREDSGWAETIEEDDLYTDVRPALATLRAAGLWVGVAGNQIASAGEHLRELDLPVDAIATSGEWGVAKPDPSFFQRVIAMTGRPPAEILYVGDHRDHDIVPATNAGLRACLIRRGPWGYLWGNHPIIQQRAERVICSLAEVVDLVAELDA